MKISVIIPVYNVENYLERCIKSVISQTFKDLEIILVDDGSTDRSGQLCDKFAKDDSRIKVIHKKNGGLSSARNSGIDIAIGEYITFVDSDDWILPDAYEYLLNVIEKTNADIVSADYSFTDGRPIKANEKYDETEIIGPEKILKYYLMQEVIHGKNDFPVWIKLYNKDLFCDVRFPDGKLYEDSITNFKIISKCNKYLKSSKIIYAYFQRPHSITKSCLSRKHLDLIYVSEEMLQLVNNNYELTELCYRKIAMSYFSVLSMYIRYGTDLSFSEIKRIVSEYKKIKKYYLVTENRLSIHFISFLMCMNIKLIRIIYSFLIRR